MLGLGWCCRQQLKEVQRLRKKTMDRLHLPSEHREYKGLGSCCVCPVHMLSIEGRRRREGLEVCAMGSVWSDGHVTWGRCMKGVESVCFMSRMYFSIATVLGSSSFASRDGCHYHHGKRKMDPSMRNMCSVCVCVCVCVVRGVCACGGGCEVGDQ